MSSWLGSAKILPSLYECYKSRKPFGVDLLLSLDQKSWAGCDFETVERCRSEADDWVLESAVQYAQAVVAVAPLEPRGAGAPVPDGGWEGWWVHRVKRSNRPWGILVD